MLEELNPLGLDELAPLVELEMSLEELGNELLSLDVITESELVLTGTELESVLELTGAELKLLDKPLVLCNTELESAVRLELAAVVARDEDPLAASLLELRLGVALLLESLGLSLLLVEVKGLALLASLLVIGELCVGDDVRVDVGC